MLKQLKGILPIVGLSLFPTLLIWAPFFLRLGSFWNIPLPKDGMATIVANFDGPLYLVVAKTFYNTAAISQNFEFPLPTEYYAAHFPFFPLLIRLFAFAIGFPWGMLIVTLISSIAALYYFKKFISQYINDSSALWLTFLFAIFPARWLIVRSVGSPEPLFVASVIASVYYFQNKKYWPAAIVGVIAQLTKSPGILLFIAFSGAIITESSKDLAKDRLYKWFISTVKKYYPLILMPLSLLGLFVVYGFTFNNFFAYFNSGDNIHLLFPPFQIFNYSADWVGTFWLEEVIFVYLFGLLGLFRLIKQKKMILAWFVGVYFTSIIFVSHRDIIRYSLPVVPFLYSAFAKELSQKEVRIVMLVLALPIFLFSLAFISQNVMPISDWTPLL